MTFLERYLWLIWHWFRIFGYLFRAGTLIIGVFVLADLVGATEFGYPSWSIVVLVAFFVAGHYLSIFGRFMLRLQMEQRRISS